MNDLELEREIRATFRRRGADVLDPQAVPPAREVLRRTRRQQWTSIATAAAVAIAVVAASIAGVSALIRSSERRIPAEPPDTFSAGPLEAVSTDWHSFGSLTAAADGTLWWTGPGLSRFDPGSAEIQTFTLADDPAFEYVSSITRAREGGVWMLTGSDEIRRFDGEAFHANLGPGPVCDLAEAPDGTLWGSGCEGGVFRWDGASWVPVPSAGGTWLGGGAIAVDAEGFVWVTNLEYLPDAETIGHGVSRFDGTEWTTWRQSDGLPSDRVETVVPAPSGDVWAGTNDGAARFRDGSWTAYPGAEIGIPDVWSIVVTDGLVLITGYERNQSRFALFDGSAWTLVTTKDGLGTTSSHPSVVADAHGVLWAATWDAGLFRLDGSRWKQVVPPGGPSGDLGLIAAAGPNELWATDAAPYTADDSYGGFPAGIWRFRGGAGTWFGESAGLPGGRVGGITVTPDGVPWAATEEGLARFDGSAWEQVASGPHDAVAVGPDGSVWTATGSTIQRVGGEALPGSVPLSARVNSFVVGPENEVWASCQGFYVPEDCQRALAHFDGQAWGVVEPPGLANGDQLRDYEVNAEGDLWVSVMVQPAKDRWALAIFRYREGAWVELVGTDTGTGLDTPFDPSVLWVSGTLETTPDGDVLILTRDGLFSFGDGVWHLVVDGRFDDLSVAPNGTVWLVGDGLFRLPPA